MAEKRMFSKKIIDTDWFMDMPASTQNLYFHLSMRADDDGFVSSPKRIIRLISASEDDYKLLVAKKFIIPFESGICVISDWRINNYLRQDRHTDTIYQEEKNLLTIDENGKYDLGLPSGRPNGLPQVALEHSISNSISNSNTTNNTYNNINIKDIKEKEEKHKYGEYNNVLLKDSEIEKLNKEYGENDTKSAIKYLDEYVEMKGIKYKSHYLALRKWVFNAIKENKGKTKHKLIEHEYTKEQIESAYTDIDTLSE